MLLVVVGKTKKTKEATPLKWEGLAMEELVAIAGTTAMFGGTETYVLTGAINGERGEEFLDMAEVFVASPHTFVFEEEKLLKAPTVALEKAGAKVEVIKTEKKERGFDPFGVTFALGARDRKKLWLATVAALRAGEKAEALAGLMHWKVRDMLGGRGADKYPKADLQNISRQLVFLYHDSHRGAGSLELLLERFALRL